MSDRAATVAVAVEEVNGCTVVRVSGDLDLSTVPTLDVQLEHVTPGPGRLVIDLGECTFLDSSALRALVRAQKRVSAAGGELVLVAPTQPARRVLEIAALDRLVPLFEAVSDAISSRG